MAIGIQQQLVQWARKNNVDAAELNKMPAAVIAKALGAAESEVAQVVAALRKTGFEELSAAGASVAAAPSLPNEAPVPQREVHSDYAANRAAILAAARAANVGLQEFAGTWKRVSGDGPETLRIELGEDNMQIWEAQASGFNIVDINYGKTEDRTWYGSIDAPGGPVVYSREATFKDGKVESKDYNTYPPGLFNGFVGERLIGRRSLELKDGKMVFETQADLLHKEHLWVGEYNRPTTVNQTNLVNPAHPLKRAEYVKV